jgi:sialate O-acetylesterase
MNWIRSSLLLAGVWCCGLTPSANAETKLPKVFSSHMVLQRDREIPVWGWDTPGTDVTVTLGDSSVSAKADDKGKWSVKLPARKVGTPLTLTAKGTSTVKFDDVLMGEVWLCSGQSNMEWTVNISNYASSEIAMGNHPRIRHIKIPHNPQDKPQDDVNTSGWETCTPKTVGNFTAVGYYFALTIQKELDVPVGLIGSNWGGTRIEPWTTPEGFKGVPALKDIADNLEKFPSKNDKGEINHQTPLALYNGMIAPVAPYAIRGALWYQGESNNGEGMLYFEKKKALIEGWRKLWNDNDMPFLFVQLAPFDYTGNPTSTSGLPYIWEAQTATLKIPNTGMAVTTDISALKDIHPRNKQDVGKRLALWALANTYGKTGFLYSGPLYKSMTKEGDSIKISFDHVGNGLISRDGKPLNHFTIAGADKKFVPATAQIRGKEVIVKAQGVSDPVAVRFGWHEEAEPNLSNTDALPASPFRTDDWK